MSLSRQHARELLVRVDRSEHATLARQVEEQLRHAIQSGLLPPGSRLPSSRALAEDIGVSRGVITRAYTQLAYARYIQIKQGSTPAVLPTTRPDRTAGNIGPRAKASYDLRGHLPEVSTFPRQLWLRSVRNSLDRARVADLGYGDPAGLWALREEIADYLGRARGVRVDPERIVVTNGSTHSLNLLSRLLSRRGAKRLAFEDPSHLLLRRVARSAGQETVPVPVDDEGLVVELLGHVPAVVVSPAHQFPTGVALSPNRRDELVAWAGKTGGVIVEDDYGAEFRYDRAPVAALQSLAPESVVYIGSTSKTLAPALRLGWTVLPDAMRQEYARELAASVLNVSGLDQLAFADFLRRGEFDRHLRRMRDLYRKRRSVLLAALDHLLPELSVRGNPAGLHVLLDMPSPEFAEIARLEASESRVELETVAKHASPSYRGAAGLILGFGAVTEPGLEVAARIIAKTIKTHGGSASAEEPAA